MGKRVGHRMYELWRVQKKKSLCRKVGQSKKITEKDSMCSRILKRKLTHDSQRPSRLVFQHQRHGRGVSTGVRHQFGLDCVDRHL